MPRTVTYIVSNGASVKIGRTRDFNNRFLTLQSMSPRGLEVLVVLPGDHEAKLHKIFKEFREMGEWFTLSDKIKEFVKQHQAGLYRQWLEENMQQPALVEEIFKTKNDESLPVHDAWQKPIEEFIATLPTKNGRRQTTTSVIWEFLGVGHSDRHRVGALRIAGIMRRLGFTRTRVRGTDRVEVGFISDNFSNPNSS